MGSKKRRQSTKDFPLADLIDQTITLQGGDDPSRPYLARTIFLATVNDANSVSVDFNLLFHRPCWNKAIDIEEYTWKIVDALRVRSDIYRINRITDEENVGTKFSSDFHAATMAELAKLMEAKLDSIMSVVEWAL